MKLVITFDNQNNLEFLLFFVSFPFFFISDT